MDHKKIANKGFEEESRYTTATYSRHGLSKSMRRIKTVRNRAAKRKAEREALREENS